MQSDFNPWLQRLIANNEINQSITCYCSAARDMSGFKGLGRRRMKCLSTRTKLIKHDNLDSESIVGGEQKPGLFCGTIF